MAAATDSCQRLPASAARHDAEQLRPPGRSCRKVRRQALEYFAEAIELRRVLFDQTADPERAADLARSLTNLGKTFSQRGDGEAAAEATREAVDLFRRARWRRSKAWR